MTPELPLTSFICTKNARRNYKL